MTTWKVRITGKQKAAPDVDLLLAAVIALGRQLRDEQRRRSAREAKQPHPVPRPDANGAAASASISTPPQQETSE
jgi:hypothetical protein